MFMQLLHTIISNKIDPSLVTVIFYLDGRISHNAIDAYYDGGRIRMTMVDRNAIYLELVWVYYAITGWNPNHCEVFLLCRFLMHTIRQYLAVPIEDDQNTKEIFRAVEIFIEPIAIGVSGGDEQHVSVSDCICLTCIIRDGWFSIWCSSNSRWNWISVWRYPYMYHWWTSSIRD